MEDDVFMAIAEQVETCLIAGVPINSKILAILKAGPKEDTKLSPANFPILKLRLPNLAALEACEETLAAKTEEN